VGLARTTLLLVLLFGIFRGGLRFGLTLTLIHGDCDIALNALNVWAAIAAADLLHLLIVLLFCGCLRLSGGSGGRGRLRDLMIRKSPVRQLVPLAAVRYLRKNGAKTVAIVGGSFGGSAAADASITSQPGEINGLALLAADWNGPAERLKAPLLVIVARDDANDEGLRLPRIRAWFDKAPQPKKLLVLEGSAHAQFLFQTNQSDRVMRELLQFLSANQR
jgi:pimeloyl-ACP methyl ester carboxylesterase